MEALAIPVKLYIHYNANTFSPDKYIVATCDMSRTFPDQYVLLETRDISIDVNQPEPFDIIALQVDQLRGQKEKISETIQTTGNTGPWRRFVHSRPGRTPDGYLDTYQRCTERTDHRADQYRRETRFWSYLNGAQKKGSG